MSESRATATAAKAPVKAIYLTMADPFEQQIAKKWAKERDKRTVSHLPIEKLTPEMTIIPVVRGIERTPMQYEEWDPVRHQKIAKQRKPDELTGELMECEPVNVGKFWSGDGRKIQVDDFTELLNGELDVSGFLDALARSAGVHEVWPRTHHGTDNKSVHLTWGA